MNVGIFTEILNKKSVFSVCMIYQWASLSQTVTEARAHEKTFETKPKIKTDKYLPCALQNSMTVYGFILLIHISKLP